MQVKPGQLEGKQCPGERVGEKVALLWRQFTSTQQRVEWLLWEDKCTWRKSSYRNTQNFIGKPPSSLRRGWYMKTGKLQVERQGASLPEGQSTRDNLSAPFICFILYVLFHSGACLMK